MVEQFVKEYSLPQAYHTALKKLYLAGDHVPCPDYNTTQLELSMTMVVENPLAEPMISKLFIGGPRELEQYRQEILDGILDFEVEKGKWAYTYHSRIASQWDWLVSELKRNPDTRRAVIIVRDFEHDSQSTDPACLQHIQYFIRQGALHCKVLFRSNDACKATFMNAFALIMLQKKLADELGVPVGSYTHRANSFHCYEKDFDLLKNYCDKLFSDTAIDNPSSLCYNYVDDWKDLMEEYQEEIAEMVEELRTH